MKNAHIEIFLNQTWRTLGVITLKDDESKGYKARTQFDFDPNYVSEFYGKNNYFSVSLGCEISFETFNYENWPPFLLDLIPQGAGRRYWENKLNLPNRPISDWKILTAGASNCAGHLRIKESIKPNKINFDGFLKSEIWTKKTQVLNELEKHGILIGTSSSVQGDAPKFFLSEDTSNLWHPSGTLPSQKILAEWLIKFPRSSKPRDQLVLRMEEKYSYIAKDFGLKVFESSKWIEDTLFIPRFDVQIENGIMNRFGLESMASAMGIAEFGARPRQEEYLETILKYSSKPANDLKEYLARDLLNVCLGNTDNHPRNTAFLKSKDSCELSPLYDFAPMYLDSEGITRVCRWSENREIGAQPKWSKIKSYLENEFNDLDVNWTHYFLELKNRLIKLKLFIIKSNLENDLLDYCLKNIEEQLQEFQ